MAILATVAFVFGLLASLAFEAAPFVAGNVILAVAVVVLGLLNGFSFPSVLLRVAVASAALQGGFLLGLMRKFRSQPRTLGASAEERRAASLRADKSTMDGSR